MAYNADLAAACRYSEEKPVSAGASAGSGVPGTKPTPLEMGVIWSGVYQDMRGRLAAVGITVGSATTANTVVAIVEAKFTSAEFMQRSISNNNAQEIPEATLLRTEASAQFGRYLNDPAILSGLSATIDTSYRLAASYHFGVSAPDKERTEFADIHTYRDTEF